MTAPACPICAGHRGEGDLVAPVVWRDDLVWVKHLVNRPMPVTLGHLLVETDRHAPHLDSLTDEEAEAIGRAIRNAAKALRAELDIDAVHAMVVNTRLEHFHEHIVVRHRGTPPEYSWHQVDEWPDAPRGEASEVAMLCERLARHFR
ncbi:HIT family protein [Janibacter terrae]|uniref:HIT family protein n=1 Tax=Janibacter terrae TaxID=103817 RepID=UPI00381A819F